MFDAQRVKNVQCHALLSVTFLASLLWFPPENSDAQGLDARAVAFAVEKQLINAIEKSEKSVVAISKIKTRRQQIPSRIPAPFGLDPNQGWGKSHDPQNLNFIPNDFGSGILIPDPTKQNRVLILTNYHLTKGGPIVGQKTIPENRIYVHTTNQRGFYAEILAADPRSDLTVLTPNRTLPKSYAQSLLPIKYGSTKAIRKGQFVIALGNPYAIARDGSPSASWGIVSNFHRFPIPIKKDFLNQELEKKETLHHFGTLLQVDTHLDLGTSGGALLDLDGNLIGVTTALAALEGYEKSTGYAIPINEATLRIINSLAAGLEAEYGFLGIQPEAIDQEEVEKRFVGNIMLQEPYYVEAKSVKQHSPAHRAGMLPGDLILTINGQK
ncbi:MAG: trypsin-like peptidase domain-containing protein, partial [Gimesia sp.]